MHRFYAPDLVPDRDVVPLPLEEARHLARVLRLKAGASVLVFDGRGNEFTASVEAVSPRHVTVRLKERHAAAIEPRVPLTLAQALLKSDKMDRVIRDAVMLGVAAVQPFLCTRAEISRAVLRGEARRERWDRIVIGSVKQCGRATVPVVRAVRELDELLALKGMRRSPSHPSYMLVEPAANGTLAGMASLAPGPRPSSATIYVGPEGGWTAQEIELALRSGVTPLTFGTRTFRAEAAGAVAITLLQFVWGDL